MNMDQESQFLSRIERLKKQRATVERKHIDALTRRLLGTSHVANWHAKRIMDIDRDIQQLEAALGSTIASRGPDWGSW